MPPGSHLEIIPLGGLGEFGMNLMVYRWGRDAFVVDAGMMFPGAEHLGVEVVIPDLAFLESCGTLHGVVLTHGHEDHIGALSYLLGRHDLPVFATPHTTRLVRHRLEEHGLARSARLEPLPDTGAIRLGPFEVEPIVAAHSIPESRMLAIHTPAGTVLHTADFKLDPEAPNGAATDLGRIAELGRTGVLALLSDSTNADRRGFTPSEAGVAVAIERLVASAPARVVVGVFASHIHRVQQIAAIAARQGRKLALIGTSLRTHVQIAEEGGLLTLPAGLRIPGESVMDLPPEEVLVVASGSQGEPMSALARISVDRHREMSITPGDLVIHSARKIPGNEKSVSRMIDHLMRRGARVVTADDEPVHVSGHASADELRLLVRLVRPRYFVPIHGEYRQLHAHAALARDCGMPASAVRVAESGDVLALGPQGIEIADHVHVGQLFVDADLGKIDWEIVRERRRLADSGLVIPIVALDRETGVIDGYPEILARGFVPTGEGDAEKTLAEARRVVAEAVAEASPEERADEGLLRAKIQTELKRFLRPRTRRTPLVIPVILEL